MSTTFDLSKLGLSVGTHSITAIAKASGYLNSVPSNAVSYEATTNTYNITTNLSNCYGYSTNPTQIDEGEEVTLYFVANGGYIAPTSIYVSGAEYSYIPFSDKSGGGITISNPTGAVYVSVSCVEEADFGVYNITIVNKIGASPYSNNPTQISTGETVELNFQTDLPSSATAVGADCEDICEESTDGFVYYILTVTLSNPTGDVTVTLSDGKPTLELPEIE